MKNYNLFIQSQRENMKMAQIEKRESEQKAIDKMADIQIEQNKFAKRG